VAAHTWLGEAAPEYPERLWNKGVRMAGLTFGGNPWSEHGRRIYAYDPVIGRMVMVRGIRLTTGYEPEWLRSYPAKTNVAPDALVTSPSSYVKYATFTYDSVERKWTLLGPAPAGLDTLLTTPLGAMGVNVNWPARLNDAGYQLPWSPAQPPEDNALYLLRQGRWERLGEPGPSPQNLYEQTSLAWDSRRERIILHGGGARRDQLWTFDLKTRRWTDMRPRVLAPAGAPPPACSREAVYIPGQDVFLTVSRDGAAATVWVYAPAENAWRQARLAGAEAVPKVVENRALVYDPTHDLVLMVLGPHGDGGTAELYALRYRHAEASFNQGP
jgi:hypothetical protein